MRRDSRREGEKRRGRRLVEELQGAVVLPMFPDLDATALEAQYVNDLRPSAFKSRWTNLMDAEAKKNELVRACLGRYGPGRAHVLREILEASERFAYEPGMAGAMADALMAEGRTKRGAGRPRGSWVGTCYLHLAVAHVIEGIHEKTGISKEKIYRTLGDRGFQGYSYSGLRQIAHEGLRHPQMQSLFFTRADQRVVRRVRGAGPSSPSFLIRGVTIVDLAPASMVPIKLEIHQGGRVQRATLFPR